MSPILTDSQGLLVNLGKIVILGTTYCRFDIRPANQAPEKPQTALFRRP